MLDQRAKSNDSSTLRGANRFDDRSGGRVLTGDRPTGSLHIGHYFGTIANRVALQQSGHDVLVVVADYQVIADRDRPGDLRRTVVEMVLDYLACGLDPARTTIFPHSQVPALNQLMLPFLSLVSIGELERNPTIKDEIRFSTQPAVSGLMLTYPVHQAADILFCQASLVPVGRDQLPHLELTRTIARRFNERYGEVFQVPEALLGEATVLAGLDGQKMSKSRGNAITLRDSDETIRTKLRAAPTDSERLITFEPHRRPEIANLLRIAALCRGADPTDIAAEVGDSGARELKNVVAQSLRQFLAPIRRRREVLCSSDAEAVLERGIARATLHAEQTLALVRSAMGMEYGTDSTAHAEKSRIET
ncbi:tryptophan--tRNA ligase [Jatrophihabitans sp. DSM 45814]